MKITYIHMYVCMCACHGNIEKWSWNEIAVMTENFAINITFTPQYPKLLGGERDRGIVRGGGRQRVCCVTWAIGSADALPISTWVTTCWTGIQLAQAGTTLGHSGQGRGGRRHVWGTVGVVATANRSGPLERMPASVWRHKCCCNKKRRWGSVRVRWEWGEKERESRDGVTCGVVGEGRGGGGAGVAPT